jgi:hypothetical protein
MILDLQIVGACQYTKTLHIAQFSPHHSISLPSSKNADTLMPKSLRGFHSTSVLDTFS